MNKPVIIANTIHIADTNARFYDGWDVSDPHGGVIEFRGDFINATRNSSYSLRYSTMRVIGTDSAVAQAFEAPQDDQGAVDPTGVTSNFGLAKLTLGIQYNPGTGGFTTNAARLYLTDTYTNGTGPAAEALYVENLQLYGGSTLYLRDLHLYYKNSGSWTLATVGSFAYGDGTGSIRSAWPIHGTVIQVR